MTIEELKAAIAEIDARLDNDELTDAEFDKLNAEAQALTAELGRIESAVQLKAVKTLNHVSDWGDSFLRSFDCGTRKITNKQAEIFKRFNDGNPFIYADRRYDCTGGNYRVGFGTLIVTNI